MSRYRQVRLEDAIKEIWPFYLAMFNILMLVTYVPEISLWMVHRYG